MLLFASLIIVEERRLFTDAISAALSQIASHLFEESSEKLFQQFLEGFTKTDLVDIDALAACVADYLAQFQKFIADRHFNDLSEKTQHLLVVIRLEPLLDFQDAYLQVESKSLSRFFRALDCNEAGMALKERAKSTFEGLRLDRAIIEGLESAIATKGKLVALLPPAFEDLAPIGDIDGLLPDVLVSCTNLHCANNATRKEFKRRFDSTIKQTIIEFAEHLEVLTARLQDRIFSQLLDLVSELPKRSTKDFSDTFCDELKEVVLGSAILVKLSSHAALKQIKALRTSFKGTAPVSLESDVTKAAEWLQWWATVVNSVVDFVTNVGGPVLQDETLESLATSESETALSFKSRCAALLREGSSLPASLVAFASAWPWPDKARKDASDPHMQCPSFFNAKGQEDFQRSAPVTKRLVDDSICSSIIAVYQEVKESFLSSLVHLARLGSESSALTNDVFLPEDVARLQTFAGHERDAARETLALKLASVVESPTSRVLKVQANLSDLRVDATLGFGKWVKLKGTAMSTDNIKEFTATIKWTGEMHAKLLSTHQEHRGDDEATIEIDKLCGVVTAELKEAIGKPTLSEMFRFMNGEMGSPEIKSLLARLPEDWHNHDEVSQCKFHLVTQLLEDMLAANSPLLQTTKKQRPATRTLRHSGRPRRPL